MAVRVLYDFVKHHVRRVFRNYNVIERTDKLLENEKLSVAPRHFGTEKKFNVIVKNSEEIRQKFLRKPEDLLERLKSMKIESSEELIHESRGKMPEDRKVHSAPEFGYFEPKIVPEGRCTLKQALKFITKKSEDPQKWTPEVIAKEYKMDPEDIRNIIDHFKVYTMRITAGKKHTVSDQTLTVLGVSKVSEFQNKEKTFFKGGDQKKVVTRKLVTPGEESGKN